MPTVTGLDILTDALIENGMLAPGEPVDGETGQWAFRSLNDLLNLWAARKAYVYSTNFTQYTVPANTAPVLLGPTGTAGFIVPQRPVRIESCAVRLNFSGGLVDAPRLRIQDAAWWAANSVKNITSTIPTDLYYDAAWENGGLYFWPIPNVNTLILLETWQAINELAAITDPIGGATGPNSLPQAYRAALKWSLAEALCPGGSKELHPVLAEKSRIANKAVFGNNAAAPKIATYDAGMARGRVRRPNFNWISGQPW